MKNLIYHSFYNPIRTVLISWLLYYIIYFFKSVFVSALYRLVGNSKTTEKSPFL
jgi:hypothetical protein